MQLTRENGVLSLSAQTYSLAAVPDRPFVSLTDAQGYPLADLFVLSSVHPLNGRDDTVRIGTWELTESSDQVIFSLRAESSLWKAKTYRFHCQPHRFTYEIEVEGAGQLAEANYFGGYYSGQLRWGSGFFWSGQHFRQMFNPEPTIAEINHLSPAEGALIDLMGVPLPGKAHWFFTPPPFCFAFEIPDGWIGLGVEALPGAHRFTEYRYHGQRGAFYLSLSYEGHTWVDGIYQLPKIGFDFAEDEYAALAAHVAALPLSRRERGTGGEVWWREPIFCGWGAQCYEAAIAGGCAPDYARQDLYEKFLRTLDENGIQPGIIVLDDKWQATYGENRVDEKKWPDLRGFIQQQHFDGRKVLLWLKAWDSEGLPAEECITNAGGLPLAVDPSNPNFEKRLRASVRHLLAPDGYDADGFKVDFTARIPSGPGMHAYGDVWGLELLRHYLNIIYDEAKRTKPDALIMTHTPHPYLADVLDMIRLNDINIGQDVNRAMRHRARVAAIACSDAIIDTDNWPITDKAAWRDYVRQQAELGVPSLYYASHIDSTREPLDPEDYQLIRDVWAEYRKKQTT